MAWKSSSYFCVKKFVSPFIIQNHRLSTKHYNDLIGPPCPISNIRPMKFAIQENETELEKLLRVNREELQSWNEKFWTTHNSNFMKEREEFIRSKLESKKCSNQSLTADEMSVFYKHFLNKNWKLHFRYNLDWHKRNFYVTFLDFRVRIKKLFKWI